MEENVAEEGKEEWIPKTEIGRMVKEKKINSIEEIFAMGKTIREIGIVDALIPNMQDKVLEIKSVQRMTKNNRRQKFRAVVVIGDMNGHVGVAAGKNIETKPATENAIKEAKRKIISVKLGCGAWECNCGTSHSVPIAVKGKCGSSEVIIKPAPKGVGIVAGETVKTVLEYAGIKDAWTFTKGRTKDIYNLAIATYLALSSLSKIKNAKALSAYQK
ncbi:MAG: 30S ribosomal protein S5 [Candidatus Micrarchaeaceae archaeon]